MKIAEMRDKKDEQLEKLISDCQEEIFNLKNELAMNRKIEKPHLIKEKRHDIAKAKTVLAERQNKDNYEK